MSDAPRSTDGELDETFVAWARRGRFEPLRVTAYSQLSCLGGTRDEHLAALAAGESGLAPCTRDLPFEASVGAVTTPLPELPAELAHRSTRIARGAGVRSASRCCSARARPVPR